MSRIPDIHEIADAVKQTAEEWAEAADNWRQLVSMQDDDGIEFEHDPDQLVHAHGDAGIGAILAQRTAHHARRIFP